MNRPRGHGGGVDVDDLARRAITGEFGNGDARKKKLGDNYAAVQARVNRMLSFSITTKHYML